VANKPEYNASSIKALTAHDHLLKRMSLTFGPLEGAGETFSKQKGTAVREITDNASDEIRGGHGTRMRLKFFKDRSFEVQDAGRGIPVDIGADAEGRPASGIYLSLGLIQSGGKFETDSKRFSSGLNGVGASSTIHVSKRADITVYRNKKEYKLSFQDGTPGFFATPNDPDSEFTPIEDLTYVETNPDKRPADEKKKYPTGTIVKVWLRDEVFSSPYPYDDQDIIERLRGTAFLVPELEAEIYNELNEIEDPETGEKKPQEELFHFPEGISALIELNQVDEKLHETVLINTTGKYIEKNVPVFKDGVVKNENLEREVPIELAFRFGNGYDYSMSSFVNTIHTKLAGVHETAFERAMTTAFNERFSSMRGLLTKADNLPVMEDFAEGLTAVLSVQISEPSFMGQSKEALSGREVQKAIQEALTTEFENWIADKANADTLAMIAKKVTTASKNRQKAREQRDLNRKKNEISAAGLPIKLLDCEFAGTEDAELYICEGDSAKSALKNARDGRIHALLPVKGKIINAHKETPKKVMANEEVQDIVKSLGAGFGSDFDLDKMRYGRVFIGTDADADGNAISCLIYALFWHLFKPVILEGRLFKLETPLFVISTKEGKKSRKLYARDESERDKISRGLDGKNIKYAISRLKGLGEVMADDLETTAMNPETRVITQITVDDVAKATEMLDIILGTDTGPRKHWIENAEIDEEALGE
jgi:DNA gyrase subunit B